MAKPLLIIGFLIFAVLLAFYPSPEKIQTTFNTSTQNLFVQSQRANMVPPPLRIVEGSVLQSNRTPGVAKPQTLGAVTSQEERTEIIKYEVESGDTVTSIAEEFDLNVDTVLWANDLTANSTIQPGDELDILPVDGVLCPVREGDTISSIAGTYDAEAEKIVEYNELEDKTSIYAGDTLIVPGGEKPDSIAAAEQTAVGENYFGFPCQGIITQGRHGPLNNAVDIANSCGSPVVATAEGTVMRAGPAGLIGRRVIVEHPNGVRTLYGHLRGIAVTPGQRVSQGTILGTIGHTGFTLGPTGCHLHYTVRGANNPLGAYLVGSSIRWAGN